MRRQSLKERREQVQRSRDALGVMFPGWQTFGAERDDLPLQRSADFAPITINNIEAEPQTTIRCWRNWASDSEGTVVWSGASRLTLTAWPEWERE